MNTQLQDGPTTDTAPERHFSRPKPVWTAQETPTADPAPKPTRKRIWATVAVTAVLAAGIGSGVALLGGDATDTPSPAVSIERPAFDSPGGNSLNIPPIPARPQPAPTANTTASAPSGFDSPGGNSLNGG